jgi:hypothetical protein
VHSCSVSTVLELTFHIWRSKEWSDTTNEKHRRADNSRPVSFTVSAWEWVYATNLSRLQRETSERERERETSKWQVREAHSVLITAILLPQHPRCYWGKIVSLRMIANLRLADLRLTIAQQRTTGQNLPSDLYTVMWHHSTCATTFLLEKLMITNFHEMHQFI